MSTSKLEVKAFSTENATSLRTMSDRLSDKLTAGKCKLIRPLLNKVLRFYQNVFSLCYKADKVGNDAA